jgi:hypothetical protein
MKKVTLAALAVVALVAVAFKVGHAQSKTATFRIVVEPSAPASIFLGV